MRATKYDKRITVKSPTETTTATGGKDITWSDLFTTWASVEPVRGIKKLEYGHTDYNYVYEVEMRKRTTNADAHYKVTYDGNDYAITSITIDDHTVKMDIAR